MLNIQGRGSVEKLISYYPFVWIFAALLALSLFAGKLASKRLRDLFVFKFGFQYLRVDDCLLQVEIVRYIAFSDVSVVGNISICCSSFFLSDCIVESQFIELFLYREFSTGRLSVRFWSENSLFWSSNRCMDFDFFMCRL